jgi:hypothetical protein
MRASRWFISNSAEYPPSLIADIDGESVGFHPSCPDGPERRPAIIELLRDIRTNEPRAIRRTFLTPSGVKVGKAKALGPQGGTACKLTPHEEVIAGLTVGEGLETVLSGVLFDLRPAWALGSAGELGALPVLGGIECLTILVDNDHSGTGQRLSAPINGVLRALDRRRTRGNTHHAVRGGVGHQRRDQGGREMTPPKLSTVASVEYDPPRGGRRIGKSWGEPDWSILDDRRGELPDFPNDVFSPTLQGWLERAAHGAGVTTAHVAVPLLGVSSSLIGIARCIRPSRTWSEPCSMWTAIVADSGTGKTHGLDVPKRALARIGQDRKDKLAGLELAHETKVETAKVASKKWKADLEAAKNAG